MFAVFGVVEPLPIQPPGTEAIALAAIPAFRVGG